MALIVGLVWQRMVFASNPATFVFGGVVFGTTSVDPLFDMSADYTERYLGAANNRPERLPRLAQHLLEQRSFYPLFPPSKDTPLDLAQYSHVTMPVTPNVLILPSRLQPFARGVDGTLVVQPGSLAKARSGGTYAKLELAPFADLADSTTDVATVSLDVPACARVQVVRI